MCFYHIVGIQNHICTFPHVLFSTGGKHIVEIRNAWLFFAEQHINCGFILGETDNKTLFENITKEAGEHDIQLANFQDMYRNLTLKTIAEFHRENENCAHARFVMINR